MEQIYTLACTLKIGSESVADIKDGHGYLEFLTALEAVMKVFNAQHWLIISNDKLYFWCIIWQYVM